MAPFNALFRLIDRRMMDPDGLELEEALFGDRRGKEEEEDDEEVCVMR